MEITLCQFSNKLSPLSIPNLTTKQPQICPQKMRPRRMLKMGYGGQNGNLVERELEEIEREGKEWIEMQKCKGRDIMGTVELFECLEREAIMGEDEGKNPDDYNRRALIFDKSSKVFRALNQLRLRSQTMA